MGVYIGTSGQLMGAYIGEYKPPYLCFTANTAGSTIKLNKNGSPTAVTLEISTNGTNWSSYTFGSTITLSNIGDKVYWRNSSETTTGFSTGLGNHYQFSMTGSIAGSGDINYLLNKNSTDTLSSNCYNWLFRSCSVLTSCPSLPAIIVAQYCYDRMFNYCSNLETLPELPALSIKTQSYYQMFAGCSKIKLSTTQTGEYQTPYRIPTEGTGTTASNALLQMFSSTGGTRTAGTPDINVTYYTSNEVI